MLVPPEIAKRQARIVAVAEEVWESEDAARQFLNTPHCLLDGQTPLNASMTESGALRAEGIILRVAYGVSV
jgi:putative toxin-antitoxin system antitoxin component (TIGR02293 family)